jgi:FkbM family methyltransferase
MCFVKLNHTLDLKALKEHLREMDDRLYWTTEQHKVLTATFNSNFLYPCPLERIWLQQMRSDPTQYQKDVDNLVANVSLEAKDRIMKILKRLTMLSFAGVATRDSLYTPEEQELYTNAKDSMAQVKKIDDYYQYKNFKLPIHLFEWSVFYYKHNIDNLKTFKNIGAKAIIDVGGFIGDSVLIFRSYCKNEIHSFEPTTQNYNLMLKTIELNKLENVVPVQTGLGDKVEDNTIALNLGASAIISGEIKSPQESPTEKIQMDTLDNYVKIHNLKVGLIKVDIEGFEQYFLKGAIETIKSQKPILLLSVYHNYDDFFQIKPFIENLNLGYEFDFHKPLDEYISLDTVLVCEVKE